MNHARIVDLIELLALAKGKPVSPDVAGAYATILEPFPFDLVKPAVTRLLLDPDPFIPPVGAIVAEMVKVASERPTTPILGPEQAWKVAKRIAGRVAPTRPKPEPSGNPAIDGAMDDLGGAASMAWHDEVSEGFMQRAFLKAYAARVGRADHLLWAVSAPERPATVVKGIEGPAGGLSSRSARLTPGEPMPELPRPAGRELSETERAAVREEVRVGIARIVSRQGVIKRPVGSSDPDAEPRPMTTTVHNGKVVVVYDDEK